MKNRTLVAAGMIALASLPAGADTYYVRTTGDNSNAGTSAGSAWATVEYACDQAIAGDTIYVGAGTYTDELTPDNDGTSTDRIVVIGDTGGTWTGDSGTILLRRSGRVLDLNDNYWTFRNIAFERSNDSGECVKVDNSTDARFENCTFAGADKCIKLKDSTVTITDATVTGMKKEGIEVDGGTVTLTNITLDDSTDNDRTIEFKSGATFTIDRCRVLDGLDPIYINDSDGTILNTLVADTGGAADDGIKITNSGSTVAVINCTIWGVADDGLDVDDGDVTVRNCIFSDIGDSCMEGSSSTIDADTNVMWQYGGSRSAGFNSPNENYYDPLFTDEAGFDFSLQASSGAIDDGLDMSSYTSVDMDGGARPSGSAYDIGAYEYGSAAYTAADVPYSTDFESGAGAEWVDASENTHPSFTDYLGDYTDAGDPDESTSLYLNTITGTTYTLTFDFFTFDDWEGDLSQSSGDTMDVIIDGATVFSESFDQNANTNGQTYTGMPEMNSNVKGNAEPEAIYRDITIEFVASGSETEIVFRADLSATDESWGIDNVAVSDLPPVFLDVSSAAAFNVDTNTGGNNSSGWHWADFDLDGDLDAYVSGASAYLMRQNVATGVFSPYLLGSYGRGTAVLDVDDDGDPDLFNANISHMSLLENLGGFPTDRGDCGVDGVSNAEGAVAMDIDADGTCEIVVLSQGGNYIARNMGAGYLGYAPVGYEDSEDVADGLNDSGDYGNGDHASAADVNNDGYLDLFYHYGTGKLFKSNGDGTFTEDAAGISVYTNNSYKFGSAWGDYDNDGDMDLFAPDGRSGNAGTLWRNSSDAVAFTEVASSAGITATDAMWSAAWGDYDNDGDLDLYIATGSGSANLLYTNNGDGTFSSEDLGAAITGDFQDAVFVDYDNDGDLDISLALIDGDGRAVLLQNQTDNDAYLKVRLVGTGTVNTLAIGARVELLDDAGSTLLAIREVGTARGHGGTEPLWAHFGGVDAATAYTLRVVWPGGETQSVSVTPNAVSTTIGSTTINQMITIESNLTTGAKFVRWREADPTE